MIIIIINEKEWKTLIQAVRIYNQEKGMEFVIEKRAVLIKKAEDNK